VVLQGTALVGAFTFSFSAHGKRGEWHVAVTTPGGITSERETQEDKPYGLLNEMLVAALDSASHQRIPAPAGAQR
jgi:hypothetical protein